MAYRDKSGLILPSALRKLTILHPSQSGLVSHKIILSLLYAIRARCLVIQPNPGVTISHNRGLAISGGQRIYSIIFLRSILDQKMGIPG